MVESIRHPHCDATIEGKRLKPGDRIQPGDKYAGDRGWETSSLFVGRVIEQDCKALWVREA